MSRVTVVCSSTEVAVAAMCPRMASIESRIDSSAVTTLLEIARTPPISPVICSSESGAAAEGGGRLPGQLFLPGK